MKAKDYLLITLMIFILVLGIARAQLPGAVVTTGSGVPSGACVNGSLYTDNTTGFIWPCAGGVWVAPIPPVYHAQSAGIGGSPLSAGTCVSTTNAIAGVTNSMAVSVTPNADPGPGAYWTGLVSSPGVVTTSVCAVIALTPVSAKYTIRVIP